MKDFNGRTAFVTGGASGIGLAIARALAAEGAKVTIADIDGARVQEVCDGSEMLGVQLDVSNAQAWQAAKETAEGRHGPVDLLFNNAGIGSDGNDLADIEIPNFQRIVAINLGGTFNGIATFAADMRARRTGHIVNTGSIVGLLPITGSGAYVASKFGVVGMSEALRLEMEPYGVSVSVICPGMVATSLNETTARLAGSHSGRGRYPLSDGMSPAQVAAQVLGGVRASRLHIYTHPEWLERVQDRHDGVIADFNAL